MTFIFPSFAHRKCKNSAASGWEISRVGCRIAAWLKSDLERDTKVWKMEKISCMVPAPNAAEPRLGGFPFQKMQPTHGSQWGAWFNLDCRIQIGTASPIESSRHSACHNQTQRSQGSRQGAPFLRPSLHRWLLQNWSHRIWRRTEGRKRERRQAAWKCQGKKGRTSWATESWKPETNPAKAGRCYWGAKNWQTWPTIPKPGVPIFLGKGWKSDNRKKHPKSPTFRVSNERKSQTQIPQNKTSQLDWWVSKYPKTVSRNFVGYDKMMIFSFDNPR